MVHSMLEDPLEFMVKEVQAHLDPEEMIYVRTIPLEEDIPGMAEVHEEVDVEHGLEKFSYETFLDMDMKRAYIITSKKTPTASEALAT